MRGAGGIRIGLSLVVALLMACQASSVIEPLQSPQVTSPPGIESPSSSAPPLSPGASGAPGATTTAGVTALPGVSGAPGSTPTGPQTPPETGGPLPTPTPYQYPTFLPPWTPPPTSQPGQTQPGLPSPPPTAPITPAPTPTAAPTPPPHNVRSFLTITREIYECGPGECWGEVFGDYLMPNSKVSYYATGPSQGLIGTFSTGDGRGFRKLLNLDCGLGWTGVYATATDVNGVLLTTETVNSPCEGI